MAKKQKSEIRIWVILNEEEAPVGLQLAKTSTGAKKKYEERTGNSRHGVHVEMVEWDDEGYYPFTALH